MRFRPAILVCALLTAPAAGQLPPPAASPAAELDTASPVADARRAQVSAAGVNAAAVLRAVVLNLEVGRGLRVNDVVAHTHGDAVLDHAMTAARPLGGPRWVDEQTCQVQTVVPGAAVADAVATLAARDPDVRRFVRPDALARRLSEWRRTAFSATGSSVAGGAALQQARPELAGGVWSGVSDDDRRRTVAAAQTDAVGRATADLHRVADPLPLGGRVRGGEVLARPAVADRVRAFLDAQPVTHIEFLDDRTVTLSMSVDTPGLARTVQAAVSSDQPRVSAAANGDWPRFRAAVARSVAAVVTGSASAPAGPAGAPSGLPDVVLPLTPPGWSSDTLQADGSAPPAAAADRLKQTGLAEAAAVARLREQLLALHVTPTSTLGDAARADPLLAAGVSRVLAGAHDYKVDYRADGSVTVGVSLDLRDAWDQLRSNP